MQMPVLMQSIIYEEDEVQLFNMIADEIHMPHLDYPNLEPVP